MTRVEQLSNFVVNVSFRDISGFAVRELKNRVLDAIGCAIGALDHKLIRLLRNQIDDFGGRAQCTLIGGAKTAPDRAAFFNSALVRYLDFNDSYLAKGETCHPRDRKSIRLNSS